MVYRQKWFQKVGDLAGFEYQRKGTHQRFNRGHLEEIAEVLEIDHEEYHIGRLKEKIAEECGFRFEQGYSTNPRDLNSSEVQQIHDTLQTVIE